MIRIIVLIVLLIASPSWGVVLFETNFEGADWTHTQGFTDSSCYSGCGIPNNFTMYRDGLSYCGSVGNNNMYMKTGAGATTSSNGAYACRSGSKCITFWNEGCAPGLYEDSDGNVGFTFTETYEIYISFWIRFQPTYTYTDDTQSKIVHFQYYSGGNPWSYFDYPGTNGNHPSGVLGLYRYGTNVYFSWIHRGTYYNSSAYPQWGMHNGGTPDYTPEFNSDFDGASVGNHDQVFRSNAWHHVEWRILTNSGTAGNFNADGIVQFWYDGVLKDTWTGVAANKNQPGFSRRGWNFVSIGGNNNQGVTPEQWYSIDDLVVSTDYKGPSYVIGGADTTAPVISGGLPTTVQKCTTAPASVTLQATTDESATCKYSTTDVAYASMANTFSTTGTTSHSQALSLGCGISYTYYVRCIDGSDNANTSSTAITFSVEKKTMFRR